MNPHDQAKLDAIERDRQRRERALILALLFLCDEAENDAYVMLKHGQDPGGAITTILRGAVGKFSTAMADAFRDGVRRMAVLADETIPQSGEALRMWKDANAGTTQDLVRIFQPAAQDATNAIVKSLTDALDRYVPGEFRNPDSPELKPAVHEAFDATGYTLRNNYGAALGAERAIVTSHNDGMFHSSMARRLTITGLRHVSIMDFRTTQICIERNGLVLPLDDPYWLSNIPALHWRCRSSVLPVFTDGPWSESYPVTPPAPGFGFASAVFIDRLRGAA